jgi:hypothetical protein
MVWANTLTFLTHDLETFLKTLAPDDHLIRISWNTVAQSGLSPVGNPEQLCPGKAAITANHIKTIKTLC